MNRPPLSTPLFSFYLLVSILALVAGPLEIRAQFSEFYWEDEELVPTWDSGIVSTSKAATGYVLVASSQVELDPPATYPVSSLVRFDDATDQLWSVSMDTGPDAFGDQLIADFGDPSKFFAGYVDVDGSSVAHLGLVNGSDLTPVFAHQLAVEVDSVADIQLGYFPGMVSTVLQDLGSSIRFQAFDAAGSVIFNKSYSSADFLAAEIQGFSTQTVKVSQIPDQSGFFISVLKAELNISTFMQDNTFILFNVDNTGDLRWAKSFEISTGGFAADTSGPGPDGSYLYWITDLNLSTAVPTSNIIKVSSSGSLEYANSFEGIRFSSVFPNEAESSLYFSGTLSVPGSMTMSNFGVAKINFSSGAIESQIGIDQAAGEIGLVTTAEANSKVFGTLLHSDDPNFEETTTTVFRLDDDLTNPIGTDYSGDTMGGAITVKSNSEVLFSAFHEGTGTPPETGVIGAFSLDTDLLPTQAGCESFTPVTIESFSPGLTAVSLSVTLTDSSITAANETSTLSEGTLPLMPLDIVDEFCPPGSSGTAAITTQPSNQEVSIGANVTFSVIADGSEPISYQWKKNGVDIEGATSSTLEITNVQEGDAGSYTVVVTDASGSVTSDPALLTIESGGEGPSISVHPSSQIVELGGSATLSVTATGDGTLEYQWYKDNIVVEGATSASLALSNLEAGDLGTYYVVVSNTVGTINSNPATLSVSTEQNAGFLAYIGGLDIPAEEQGFMDDPDDDLVNTGLEYLMGSDAGDGNSTPEIIPSIIEVGGLKYLAITFPRNTSITDLSLMTEFSTSVEFETVTEGVEVSAEDQGDGLERVTHRSSIAVTGESSVFGRISGGDE